MKFTIITTILTVLFCGCIIGIVSLCQDKAEIQKQINKKYSDTPHYYKRYFTQHKKLFK